MYDYAVISSAVQIIKRLVKQIANISDYLINILFLVEMPFYEAHVR